MKTYRLLLVIAIWTGIPTYLSYLAYKAAIININSFGQPDVPGSVFVAAMAWIITIALITLLLADTFNEYLEEN